MTDTTVTLHVEWDDSECDCGGPLPPPDIAIPLDIYEAGMSEWDDLVADYLSNATGFLVKDWRLAE